MQASNMEADTPSSHALQNSGTALGLKPSVSGNGFYVTSPDAQTSNVEPSLQAWLIAHNISPTPQTAACKWAGSGGTEGGTTCLQGTQGGLGGAAQQLLSNIASGLTQNTQSAGSSGKDLACLTASMPCFPRGAMPQELRPGGMPAGGSPSMPCAHTYHVVALDQGRIDCC